MPIESIRWDKHDVVECDERGRATIGSEYANKRVFVYVSEVPDPDEIHGEKIDDEVSSTLTKMLSWAHENDINTLTHLLNPVTGIVTDKKGNEHQSPHSVPGDVTDECPMCDGTGLEGQTPNDCEICEGSGEVIIND